MQSIEISLAIQRIAIAFIPFLLGMICHEVAHGWVAYKLGDPTAKYLGRLTLNPLPHLDPMGSLFFILTSIMSMAGPAIIFGWAKPVPIVPRHFKNPPKGMMLSSLAGPMTNLLLAAAFAALFRLTAWGIASEALPVNGVAQFILNMFYVGVWINVTLACFNLIPLPPLDGSHILSYFLPYRMRESYARLARYGMIIILLLLVTNVFSKIIGPIILLIATTLLGM